MKIIALGHRRNVGKNIVAKLLTEHLHSIDSNLTIQTKGFADPLYDICSVAYGWAGLKDKFYYDYNREAKEEVLAVIGKSPRELLIEVGAFFRSIYADHWVRMFFDFLVVDTDYLIITDLRFPNEVAAVKKASGICVRVDRPVEQFNDSADGALAEFANWDFIIDNNGMIGGLMNQVKELISEKEL